MDTLVRQTLDSMNVSGYGLEETILLISGLIETGEIRDIKAAELNLPIESGMPLYRLEGTYQGYRVNISTYYPNLKTGEPAGINISVSNPSSIAWKANETQITLEIGYNSIQRSFLELIQRKPVYSKPVFCMRGTEASRRDKPLEHAAYQLAEKLKLTSIL